MEEKNMLEKKTMEEMEEISVEEELDLDQLDQVTGGALRNVRYTKTHDISEDTRSKI